MKIDVLPVRMIAPFILISVVVVIAAGGLYAAGVISTLGYEKRHVTFSGFASGTETGGGLGLKKMVFFKGQTFFANYDVDVRTGSFRIAVRRNTGPIGGETHFDKRIGTSGPGEVTFEIPQTGFYSVIFEGSVLGGKKGRGYDVAYSVEWGAR